MARTGNNGAPGGKKRVRKSMRVNGKLISAYGATEAEAIRKLAEKATAMECGCDEIGCYMTVDSWYAKCRDLYKVPKGLTDATLKSYDGKYKNYISTEVGDKQLYEVTTFDLQKILNSQAYMSSSHLVKIRMIMREMFRRAYALAILFRDPTVGLELPSGTYKGHRALTEEEKVAFYKVCRTHPAGRWLVALLNSGMRPGESAALIWADVRFDLNEIHINRAKESGSKKIKTPKTDAGIRVIPMRPMLREMLLKAQGNPNDPVFPNKRGDFMSGSTMYSLWVSFRRALCIELGAEVGEDGKLIDPPGGDLTLYCLRHTFCTDLERGSVAINLAKKLMGHNNITTTGDIYTHSDREMLHKCIEMYDQVAGGYDLSEFIDLDIPWAFDANPAKANGKGKK